MDQPTTTAAPDDAPPSGTPAAASGDAGVEEAGRGAGSPTPVDTRSEPSETSIPDRPVGDPSEGDGGDDIEVLTDEPAAESEPVPDDAATVGLDHTASNPGAASAVAAANAVEPGAEAADAPTSGAGSPGTRAADAPSLPAPPASEASATTGDDIDPAVTETEPAGEGPAPAAAPAAAAADEDAADEDAEGAVDAGERR